MIILTLQWLAVVVLALLAALVAVVFLLSFDAWVRCATARATVRARGRCWLCSLYSAPQCVTSHRKIKPLLSLCMCEV